MIRTAAALLLAAAALASAPAAAQTATVTVDPARRALGYELAKLLNPEGPTMVMVERLIDEQAPKAMMTDPAFQELERKYPGLVKALIAAMRPIITRHMHERLPDLWDDLAVLFAGELSEEDLRAAIAFYSSPAGHRIIEVMSQSADAAPMMADMMSSGDFKVTPQHLRSTMAPGLDKLMADLPPGQMAEVEMFGRSATGRKIATILPRLTALVLEWSNAPTPELDAEIAQAVTATFEQFTGMKITP